MKRRGPITGLGLIAILLLWLIGESYLRGAARSERQIDSERSEKDAGESVPNDRGYLYNRRLQIGQGPQSFLSDCFGPFDLPELGLKVNFARNIGRGGSYLFAISPRNYNSYYGVRNWGKALPPRSQLYVLVGVDLYAPKSFETSLIIRDRLSGKTIGGEIYAYQDPGKESPPLSPGTTPIPPAETGWRGWIFPVYDLPVGEYQAEVLVNDQLLCGGNFDIK